MVSKTSMKQPANVDVAVLILFFNRPEPLRQVFDEVKKARPSQLFLYQDGPRGEKDLAGIEACRQIVADSQIDWECDVHRQYLEKNQGCDPSGHLAQKWAFSLADKCIVLEDDCVPSQAFFPFCKEMLDRYEDDQRVFMIAGFNVDEVTPDCPYDYFFTSTFSIWGWASWRRAFEQRDEQYGFLQDDYAVRLMEGMCRERKFRGNTLSAMCDHRDSGKLYHESLFRAAMLLNSGLAIMPAKNMISNVGITDDSTHFAGSLKTLPRGYRRIFTMGRHELTFPLRHPKYVMEDVTYKERMYKVNAWGHPWIKVGRSFEELFLNLRYGNFSVIITALARRLRKTLGLEKYK